MKRTPLVRRTPLKARSELKRDSGLKRRTPMPKVNRNRSDDRFARDYHSEDYVEAVHKLGCYIPGCDGGPVEADHGEQTKRYGGWRSILPLCLAHHREKHGIGKRTFERKYGVSLEAAARETRKALAHITKET